MVKSLRIPYIPTAPVTKALVAADAPKEIFNSLLSRGIEPIRTGQISGVALNLSFHPDMQFVNICHGLIVYAPGIPYENIIYLKNLGFDLIEGNTSLSRLYPNDIAYNSAIVGRFGFMNMRYSDTKVIELLYKCGIKPIHTNQGYSKCSIAILNEEAIITADKSIHKKAVEVGIDSLLIPPQKNILLKGCDYGFIGGSTGLISKNQLAFAGDFKSLDSADLIFKFLVKYGISPVSLSNDNVVDVGSIIPLCSV